jgi:transcription elongation factor Elf1
MLSAAQRRALVAYLAQQRCPRCQRADRVRAVGDDRRFPPAAVCGSCGWTARLTVRFTTRPHQGVNTITVVEHATLEH